MTAVVLDASAVLALLHREPGWEMVAQRVAGAIIGTVNLVEVMDKLTQQDVSAQVAKDALNFLKLDIRDFTQPLAEMASALLTDTKPFGLSFGDRACLALAKMENATALTGDRAWQQVKEVIGVEVALIR
ncbi:type II toxin-antitoxin system VapC family toxin [Chroococcidiopsis sp. CCMEE 29]|uniref:type II toxin-antitoxin system VapC family toxin n=1 Tax=Chroococcidiopsis sp. CCMEE 29 TaxID=155894 RepID=UPI0020224E3D|nr:type II toxin-antitoxin system VapC family toxin [Chroococcidiopsis sp. CCMEE 29]